MHLSYWEQTEFFGEPDTVIIGAGITGLSTALEIKAQRPNEQILVLERGALPAGASTRNAGFACFGSPGELLDDLSRQSEDESLALLRMRWEGLRMLRNRLGDKAIDYDPCGSLELFGPKQSGAFEACKAQLDRFNAWTTEICGSPAYAVVASPAPDAFPWAIANRLEGAINTGKMMRRMVDTCSEQGIVIRTGTAVAALNSAENGVHLALERGTLSCERVVVCTNGFARELLPDLPVQAVRNQVWITAPIPQLSWRGTFHADRGYVYFRNVGNRLLIGGFRNEFPATETTASFGMNQALTERIHQFTADVLLPGVPHAWDMGWSGILGVGSQKTPIVRRIDDRVTVAVRLGGMGVAIGTWLGKTAAENALAEGEM